MERQLSATCAILFQVEKASVKTGNTNQQPIKTVNDATRFLCVLMLPAVTAASFTVVATDKARNAKLMTVAMSAFSTCLIQSKSSFIPLGLTW